MPAAPVVHFEIGCRNAETAKKFYGPLFGWEFEAYGPAQMLSNVGKQAGTEGIGGHVNVLGHEPHNYVTVYALVPDLNTTIEKAKKLGGKQIVPPTEVPGMGHFAWIADPEGNVIGLWKAIEQG
jgi:predicted enzyme related to lactoylglutathione lyase